MSAEPTMPKTPQGDHSDSGASRSGGCALGTSFARRQRKTGERPLSGPGIVDEAIECGAEGLVICDWDGLPGEVLAELSKALVRRRDELAVWAIAGLCGAALLGRPKLSQASLCSLDRDEARAAAQGFAEALRLAEELGAPFVYLTLGPIAAVRRQWDGIRRLYLRGELVEGMARAESLMSTRNAAAGRHLDACRRALEGLCTGADRRGLQVLLANPRRGIEMPSPLELSALLLDLHGAPLAPLLDLPAAHLASGMRLFPLGETITAFGQGPLCFLGDACGAVGALAPGHGEVDVAAVARHIPAQTRRAFLPWTGLRLHEVAEGMRGMLTLPRKT